MSAPTGEVERVANWLEGKFTVSEMYAAARGDLGDIRDHAAKLLRSLAKDAERWQKLMQVVKPDDLLPFESVFSETSWGHVIGYRECWTDFDAAIDRAIEAAGRTEGGGG